MQPRFIRINRKIPIVTYVTIGIMVAVFAIDTLSAFLTGTRWGILSLFGMKINDLIVAGQYWRLITPNFLHSGFSHAAMNCFGLYIWGRYIETFYGRGRTLAIMLLSALMCVIFSFAFSPTASLGASGIVFGLYGALLGVRKFDKGFFNAVFGVQLLVYIGFSVISGFTRGSVDNFGHIGGLVGGFLASRIVCLLTEKQPAWLRTLWALGFILIYCVCAIIGILGVFNQ